MIDDFFTGFKNAVGMPVVPDVFDATEFWAFGRQRDDADSLGYDECRSQMPPGPIHEHACMGAGGHGLSNFDKVQVHRVGITERQDKACPLAECWTDCPKDAGRYGALILRRRCPSLGGVFRALPTRRPAVVCKRRKGARNVVFLPYEGLVLEPDLYCNPLREACANSFKCGCKAPFQTPPAIRWLEHHGEAAL